MPVAVFNASMPLNELNIYLPTDLVKGWLNSVQEMNTYSLFRRLLQTLFSISVHQLFFFSCFPCLQSELFTISLA